MPVLLLFSVFVVATCGLMYELVAGTLASYLLGDSVMQFSTVIGAYLFAMGVGSYLSRYVHGNPLSMFIRVEILVGILGGLSSATLFLLFGYVSSFRIVLYGLVFMIGTLVGLEIPLLMRALQDKMSFKDLVSRVLSFDYVGALAASVLFPLVLAPQLGLIRTSVLFGIFNIGVALWVLILFGREIPGARSLRTMAAGALVTLCAAFAYADEILTFSEAALYPENVIYAKSSPYQRIVLTRSPNEIRLYLNGHLQFDSRDEYRYHESLVHIGLAGLDSPRNVLVLGGGDGMAVRELLKHSAVEQITLVDLDAEITDLFRKSDMLADLNGGAFRSPKVRIVNTDAFVWIRESQEQFDYIVIDLPDPTNFSIGKLYSTLFYRLLSARLKDGGAFVVQSTSPLMARRSFWCVEETIRQSGFNTLPYHVTVPSFGEWGFILASKEQLSPPRTLPEGLQFLDEDMLPSLFHFPRDMQKVAVEPNRLNNQALVHYYEEEWSRYVS